MAPSLRFACAVPIGSWHAFLPAALESLACQDVPLDVALLDASGDPRVTDAADRSGIKFAYTRHGPDQGQSDAIAEGWANLGGDVLFWLNADDRLMPGALSRVSESFIHAGEPDIVFGGSDFINERGEIVGHHDQVADVTALLLRSNTISQPSCFARRSWIDRVGGVNRDIHFVMDWDLWTRLYLAGAKFTRIDETLSAVYMGEDTKTGLIAHKRLREVYALVHRNTGHWSAFKSTVSLALETLRRRWFVQ